MSHWCNPKLQVFIVTGSRYLDCKAGLRSSKELLAERIGSVRASA